jgi:hypothetical protein
VLQGLPVHKGIPSGRTRQQTADRQATRDPPASTEQQHHPCLWLPHPPLSTAFLIQPRKRTAAAAAATTTTTTTTTTTRRYVPLNHTGWLPFLPLLPLLILHLCRPFCPSPPRDLIGFSSSTKQTSTTPSANIVTDTSTFVHFFPVLPLLLAWFFSERAPSQTF